MEQKSEPMLEREQNDNKGGENERCGKQLCARERFKKSDQNPFFDSIEITFFGILSIHINK